MQLELLHHVVAAQEVRNQWWRGEQEPARRQQREAEQAGEQAGHRQPCIGAKQGSGQDVGTARVDHPRVVGEVGGVAAPADEELDHAGADQEPCHGEDHHRPALVPHGGGAEPPDHEADQEGDVGLVLLDAEDEHHQRPEQRTFLAQAGPQRQHRQRQRHRLRVELVAGRLLGGGPERHRGGQGEGQPRAARSFGQEGAQHEEGGGGCGGEAGGGEDQGHGRMRP